MIVSPKTDEPYAGLLFKLTICSIAIRFMIAITATINAMIKTEFVAFAIINSSLWMYSFTNFDFLAPNINIRAASSNNN